MSDDELGSIVWPVLLAVVVACILTAAVIPGLQDDDVSDPADVAPRESALAGEPQPDDILTRYLDDILTPYPGVSGEVIGEVAVLEGTVTDMRTKALVDQAVRDAGLLVQNNVNVDQPAAAAEPAGHSLNDLIAAQPELSTLASLLDQSGLRTTLDDNGPFTMFAPTNDAFAAIQPELNELYGDPARLRSYLLYHMLSGALTIDDIAWRRAMKTMSGESIDVSLRGNTIHLNSIVPVLVADAEARNGVMHVITGVLVPPSEVLAAPIPTALAIPAPASPNSTPVAAATPVPQPGRLTTQAIDALYEIGRNSSAQAAVLAAFDDPVAFEAALGVLAPAVCDLVDETGGDWDRWSAMVAIAVVEAQAPGSLSGLEMFDVAEALAATECPLKYRRLTPSVAAATAVPQPGRLTTLAIDALYEIGRNSSADAAVLAAFDDPVAFEAALGVLAPAVCDLVDETGGDWDRWSAMVAIAVVEAQAPGSLSGLEMFDVAEALAATECPLKYRRLIS